jgi:hypothetical protein
VYAASAAFDPGLQGVVLFGGGSGVDQNTTWLWDQVGATWIQLSTQQSPPAREGAGLAYDVALYRVILFNGQDSNGNFNDTWELIQHLLQPLHLLLQSRRLQAPQLHLHQHPLHQLLLGSA